MTPRLLMVAVGPMSVPDISTTATQSIRAWPRAIENWTASDLAGLRANPLWRSHSCTLETHRSKVSSCASELIRDIEMYSLRTGGSIFQTTE